METALEKDIDMEALSAAVAGFLACHILTCRFLVQEGVGERAIAAAAARAAELVSPDSDLHASADYRRNLTRVLTGRALTRALARAGRSR